MRSLPGGCFEEEYWCNYVFYFVHVYALFCAPVHVCNVEYFLEVGVYLSQGRFQTTLQITKQLQ